MWRCRSLPHNLVLLSRCIMCCMEQVKKSNISCTLPPSFFILSPCACENNWLLNKNVCDDLDVIDRGHSNGNVSQFCLYLGYLSTNFNKISTTIVASRAGNIKCLIIWPWKCRSRSPFTKIAISLLVYDRCLPNIHRNNETGEKQKRHISWPWKCRSPFTKLIIYRLLYYRFQPNFHQTEQLKLATKASHQPTTSVSVKDTYRKE